MRNARSTFGSQAAVFEMVIDKEFPMFFLVRFVKTHKCFDLNNNNNKIRMLAVNFVSDFCSEETGRSRVLFVNQFGDTVFDSQSTAGR